MLKRNIYFVRHGETVLNAARKRQAEAGGLNEKGRQQAFQIGVRLRDFNIKKVFCSPFQRAVETCEEINKVLKVEHIEYVPLLSERRNPSKIVGLDYFDPITIQAVNFMDKSFHAEDARWGDEENFADLKKRALELERFLIKNSNDKTLCITHGIFLKMFLCVLLRGGKLTVKEYIELSVFNPADNAGITVLEYDPLSFFSNPWKIEAYNDSPISQKSLGI